MVAYSDVPAVNMLYEEQARIDAGIALLDAGGLVSSFTVAPPPYVPPAPGDPIPLPPPMMMSQTIATIAPPAELMTAARSAMLARHNAITTELTALGVSAAPPAL
jgi:hypothetical protein